MEDGDTEIYHPSRVIQDLFGVGKGVVSGVFLSRYKMNTCIKGISKSKYILYIYKKKLNNISTWMIFLLFLLLPTGFLSSGQ